MNRRNFFSLPLAMLPATKAVEAKPSDIYIDRTRPVIDQIVARGDYREITRHAFGLLGQIDVGAGEQPSPNQFAFAARFCFPGITPAKLASELIPYYPNTKYEPLTWTPPQNCAKCGGAIMRLGYQDLVRAPLMVLTCAGMDKSCENRRPWIQFPNGRTEWVSLRARELFEDGERAEAELRNVEWNYRNRMDFARVNDVFRAIDHADAMTTFRYMHAKGAELRSEQLYKEFAPWR